jgi:hypothetical protein
MSKNLVELLVVSIFFSIISDISAQEIRIHSHNDYRQRVPFYQAYSQQAASIEADIYAFDDSPELHIRQVIDSVHVLGKPIRFWAMLDGETTWRTFHSFGVDFINTDRPEDCTAFFRKPENRK